VTLEPISLGCRRQLGEYKRADEQAKSDAAQRSFCAAVVEAGKVQEKAYKAVTADAKKAARALKAALAAATAYDKMVAKKAAAATAELKKAAQKASKPSLKRPLQSPRRLPAPPRSPPKPATAEKERRKSASVMQTSPGFYLLFTCTMPTKKDRRDGGP
jgi:hypothetical protein